MPPTRPRPKPSPSTRSSSPTRSRPPPPAFVLHGLLGSGRNWRTFSRTLASQLHDRSPSDEWKMGSLGGGEGYRACRYAYCSYKGHAPAAPPLGAFVAARRGLIKTKQSMKHRGVSAFYIPKTNPTTNDGGGGGGKGDGDGSFVQAACPRAYGARPKTASSGSCCSGLSAEEVDSPYVNFGRRGGPDPDTWGASVDGSCGSSNVISDSFADLPGTATSPSPSPSPGRKEKIGQEEA